MPLKHRAASLAQLQTWLADAVRQAKVPEDTPLSAKGAMTQQRLAVYARLVRNNAFRFIDLCYVQTPMFLEDAQWHLLKERFIQEAQAHSPYFQHIASEFYHFCKTHALLSPELLALMDFERCELQVEVSMAQVQVPSQWDNNSVMCLSGAALLRQFDYDFLSDRFESITPGTTQVLIWRDPGDSVQHALLDDLHFHLLTLVQEAPCSYNTLCEQLAPLLENAPQLLPLLAQAWAHWIQAGVLLPTS